MLQDSTVLHDFERDTVTGARYIEMRSVSTKGTTFAFSGVQLALILNDDNAWSHTAYTTDYFLEIKYIWRMDWSARSPDPDHTERVEFSLLGLMC